ncbi:peptide chain release factor 2 [Candidatus Ichthyocystis hellenicum]|uniref:peptide chain release factor 2 n=1 Tax=Candidatus Ichthyocystis hellenicum TaxID=1561003 RepID=UPI0024164F3E|nr:peptide chain release factor 2 [Candidatus Ichthyocystis hellenicum]
MIDLDFILSLKSDISDSKKKLIEIWNYLDVDRQRDRLLELDKILQDESIWSDVPRYQDLHKEMKILQSSVDQFDNLYRDLEDASSLLSLAEEESDASLILSIKDDLSHFKLTLNDMEMRCLFSQPMDSNFCFLEIQSGAGGTEAQDWAAMLLRMYLRYCEKKSLAVDVVSCDEGEVAGIKGATIYVKSSYATGLLRTETGIHRLVRKSPFDSNSRRHTSFASVFVYPEVDDSFDVKLNPADLRIDTYRASGAGGQHVNRTESAIRITHIPTNIVVQCQTDRSQHRNREEAMRVLRSRLYEHEFKKKQEAQKALEDTKSDIAWGHQIRSYVLDQSRIKDLRTNMETGNTQAFLDGDLDSFIMANLKQLASLSKSFFSN